MNKFEPEPDPKMPEGLANFIAVVIVVVMGFFALFGLGILGVIGALIWLLLKIGGAL